MHLFETFTWCAKIRGIFCCAFRVLIDWADKLQSRGLISALTIWRWTTRMRAQMKRSPPNAKINACNKKVFCLCLCENSSKTGFAHYMDGCLLRESLPLWKSTFFLETHIWGNSPSPQSNFSVEIDWKSNYFLEIDLLPGNSQLCKLTFPVVELLCWNRLKIELLPGNRLSPWKLTSVETHLLHGRTSLLKSTDNPTTSWKSTFFLETHNLWKLTFSVVELLCWNRLKIELLPGIRMEKVGFHGEGGFRGISQFTFALSFLLQVALTLFYEQKFYFVLCSWRAAVTWPYRITSFCSVLTTSSSQELYGLSLQVTKPAHISIWKFACHVTTWPT